MPRADLTGVALTLMKITIVGSGDAFGSSGRAHTCIMVASHGVTVLVDFGAGSIGAWKKLGLRFDSVDAIVISHLHGDHFGGLPFVLLDCQFTERRTKPLTLIGPPGLAQALERALALFFPGLEATKWSFPLTIEETGARIRKKAAGLALETFEVRHISWGLATGVRLEDGEKIFAYSGDTAWTEALIDLSNGADLFLVECFSGGESVPNHMNWPTLLAKLPILHAKRIVVTHMSLSALDRRDEMEKAGLILAYDGQEFDL
jgi:ribonuclease BN (tRNA processing enzyme)